MVGREASPDHRHAGRARGAIAGLALGVGHGRFANGFTRHEGHSEALRHETLSAQTVLQALFRKRQLSLPVSMMSQ